MSLRLARVTSRAGEIEQARLDREEDWSEEELIEHFQRWAQNPKVREWICGKCLSEEERVRRMREIFGLAAPEESASGYGNGEESDSIKPNQTR